MAYVTLLPLTRTQQVKDVLNLGEAMKDIKKDYKEMYNLVQQNANCVLSNEEIHVNMKKIQEKKSGIFSFLFKK
jgi:protein-tyrosine phosphatase